MHIFLDNFHQGREYSSQISSHQAQLRRDGKFTDQKSLFISYLQTDYLNIDIISGCGKKSERTNIVQKKCTVFGGAKHFVEKIPKTVHFFWTIFVLSLTKVESILLKYLATKHS